MTSQFCKGAWVFWAYYLSLKEASVSSGQVVQVVSSVVSSGPKWFQVVSSGFKWFQVVSSGAKWFQVVSSGSSGLKNPFS